MAVDVEFLNGNNVNNINNNFQRVKDVLQEVVGRNGNLPNHMNADLDMDSNDILNVNTIQVNDITIDGENVTGVLERAETAANEAEAFATSAAISATAAEDAAQSIVATSFATKALAETHNPIIAPLYIRLEGYTSAGDGGGALYKKMASEPTHAGKFSVTLDDGVTVVWYEIVGTDLSNKAFGAKVDGVTDDSAATQACVDYLEAKGGGIMRLPQGVHYWPMGSGVKLPEAFSYYTDEKQLVSVIGEGDGTIITQNKTLATDVPDHKSSTDCRDKAALIITGPNSYYRGFRFRDCVVGMFLGARDAESNSCVSHNTFEDIQAHDCGLGFAVFSPTNGIYYNRIIGLHAFQCQIGFKFDWDDDDINKDTSANVNRNTLLGCEASRCWVGFWGEAAGTTKAYGSHFEGNIDPPTLNRYSPVSSADLPIDLVQPCAIYLATLAQSNDFFGAVCEANTTDLYNAGYRNGFDGDFAQAKTKLIRMPSFFRSSDIEINSFGYGGTWFNARFSEQTSIQGQVVPGGWDYGKSADATLGRWLDGGIDRHDANRGRKNEFTIDCGAFSALENKSFVLQSNVNDEYHRSGAGSFGIEVVARTTGGEVFTITFKVFYTRASNGTVSTYYLSDKAGGFANGLGTGGTDDLFSPSVSVGGSQQLVVSLTAAAALASAVMFVEEQSIKNVSL